MADYQISIIVLFCIGLLLFFGPSPVISLLRWLGHIIEAIRARIQSR